MSEARVIKYQAGYSWLNKELFDERPKVYKAGIMCLNG